MRKMKKKPSNRRDFQPRDISWLINTVFTQVGLNKQLDDVMGDFTTMVFPGCVPTSEMTSEFFWLGSGEAAWPISKLTHFHTKMKHLALNDF